MSMVSPRTLVRICAVLHMNSFEGTQLFPALGTSPQSPGCDDLRDVPGAPRESVLAKEMMQKEAVERTFQTYHFQNFTCFGTVEANIENALLRHRKRKRTVNPLVPA